MIKLNIYNEKGEDTGKEVELPKNIFCIEPNESVVHQAVVMYLSNQRQGNASTKTRAQVKASGRKPWRQKGTGRARQGNVRAVQWKGGGVAFGPNGRNYKKKMNKKMKKLAMRSVLSSIVSEKNLRCIEKVKFDKPKIKKLMTIIDSQGFTDKKILWVVDEYSPEIVLSARNILKYNIKMAKNLNIYDLLNADKIIITPESIDILKEVYTK